MKTLGTKIIRERIDLLEGELKLENKTDENLAELVELVKFLVSEVEAIDRVLYDHVKDVV